MNAIAAVTSDWGIGRDGRLLVRDLDDMRRFRQLTDGCTVLMGRKTYESIGCPLRGRRNVVVTSRDDYVSEHPGIECAADIDAALEMVAADEPNVWLIGGESLYRALVPYCRRLYITHYVRLVDADTHFPIPSWQDWQVDHIGPMDAGIGRYYVTYSRRCG